MHEEEARLLVLRQYQWCKICESYNLDTDQQTRHKTPTRRVLASTSRLVLLVGYKPLGNYIHRSFRPTHSSPKFYYEPSFVCEIPRDIHLEGKKVHGLLLQIGKYKCNWESKVSCFHPHIHSSLQATNSACFPSSLTSNV